MNILRVVTLFSGYDSQCMSLDRLHHNFPQFDYELIAWSEIDNYAIQAHNAIYPQYADRNLGDVCKIDWYKVEDFDLLTYSSPCQDFSAAGLQKGGIKGSGTRSSLLWECERAIEEKRPKYLLMENVAALVSQKFIKLFNKWQNTLESYGYTNYAKVLNAKDYGVPQNRERIFMVSIRNDISQKFYFPKSFKLEKRLKDVLEENVDERFYLSNKIIKGFMKHNEHHLKKGTGFIFSPKSGEDIASCIRSNAALNATDNTIIEPSILRKNRTEEQKKKRRELHDKGIGFNEGCYLAPANDGLSNTLTSVQKDNLLIEPKVEQIGNIVDDTNIGFKNPQRGRIYSPNGIEPAMNCCEGGGLEPKILQRNVAYKVKEMCVDRRNGRGDAILEDDGTIRGFYRTADGGNHSISELVINNEENSSMALTTAHEPKIYGMTTNFRIRKLTPKECFRLMDVSDKDIDKLLNSGISNSQLYKLAGNSIVVSCLYHIFRKLFIETENDSRQLELF